MPKEIRSRLSSQAEEIEKVLRKQLASRLPRETLNRLLMAVEYFPTESGAALRLFSSRCAT
jgi:hypothetical protein